MLTSVIFKSISFFQKTQIDELARTKSERESDEKYFILIRFHFETNSCLCSYWERHSEYTPESRIETHEALKKKREREAKEFDFVRRNLSENSNLIFSIEPKLKRNQFGNILATMVDR